MDGLCVVPNYACCQHRTENAFQLTAVEELLRNSEMVQCQM